MPGRRLLKGILDKAADWLGAYSDNDIEEDEDGESPWDDLLDAYRQQKELLTRTSASSFSTAPYRSSLRIPSHDLIQTLWTLHFLLVTVSSNVGVW